MNKKKIIVILGNHRSGTSTITRALKIYGIDLSHSKGEIQNDNAKGHWEDDEIVKINEEIFRILKIKWYSLNVLSEVDIKKIENSGIVKKAVEVIESRLNQYKIYAFKDPRVSKNIIFWKMIFKKLYTPVFYIIVNRNPKSCAKSLFVRDKFPKIYGYHLWLSYMYPIIMNIDFDNSIFINYDFLFNNLENEIKKIEYYLDEKSNVTSCQRLQKATFTSAIDRLVFGCRFIFPNSDYGD